MGVKRIFICVFKNKFDVEDGDDFVFVLVYIDIVIYGLNFVDFGFDIVIFDSEFG